MKRGWIIAGLLLLLGFAGAFIWYSRLKNEAASEKGAYDGTLKPRLEISTLEINDIDDDQIQLTVKLLIDNPLPVGFKANRLRYTVYLAKTLIIEEEYAKPIEIEPGDSTLVVLPMRLLMNKLQTVLNTLHGKGVDSTTYGIRAAFDLDVPILGERTFTQTLEERRPTYYIPRLKIEDLDFGKVGLKQTDIAAKVSIENRNHYPYNFTDTRYTVSIDGKEIAEGAQPEPIFIKKQATTPVVFPVTVKPGQTLGLLPKMLFDKKNTPFLVKFHCKIIDKEGDLAFKNSQFNTEIRGTLADFKR